MIFHSTCNRPILLIGNGVRTSGAVDLVHSFSKKTNIPILTTMNGVDLAQDEIHLGFIGTHGNRIANMILNECDLIISVGARLGIRQVGRLNKNFAPKAKLIRCDIDEYELARNVKDDEIKFQMDAKQFMHMLLAENISDYSLWNQRCFEAKRLLEPFDKQAGNYAVEKISSLLPVNSIVSLDVGMHQCWSAQSLHLKGDKCRIHVSGGYGTMGCGLPFAIGSCISIDRKPTFCITGDGGFQMNIQELETVRREKLPIKIFILNNHVLGKIKETQHFDMGDRFANTSFSGGYTVPDFKKIAEAYNIKAATLLNFNELDLYKEWIYDDDPCLFDIFLPEDSLLTPKIKFDTGIIRPEIDVAVVKKVQSILAG